MQIQTHFLPVPGLFPSYACTFLRIDFVLLIRVLRNIVDENNITDDIDDEPLLPPPHIFEVNKRFILLKLPFCQNNEIKSKHFLKKFHYFTKNNFDIAISWETRKMQTHLKDKKL